MINLNLPFILLPLWILILGFIVSVLFWKNITVQTITTLITAFLFFLSSVLLLMRVSAHGIEVIQIGSWQAPYGITLVADLFASLMVLISSVIALAIVLYALQDISSMHKQNGFFPLMLILLFGVCGSFLTGDIFNLYVWFEVMLVSSFVLMVLGNKDSQLEGSVKYVILSFISSGFLLTGIGILYRVTGTLNMAQLAVLIPGHDEGILLVSLVFFFIGFGMKAALFPLFSWLPASYPTPPVSIAALMAGLLTKVGVYALIRFFTLLFVFDVALTHNFLLIIAGMTMFFGVLGAVSQSDFRKILSFHIISQIGYMVMGLGLFTRMAMAGAIFYIIHHILVKTNLFLISGLTRKVTGTFSLLRSGGVYDRYPWMAFLFVISAFSLAGIPPLSGFWGKFMLAQAGLVSEQYFIVGISLLVGLLTLFSMTKIWRSVFWQPDRKEVQEDNRPELKSYVMMLTASVLLTLGTLSLSLYPDWFISFSQRTADQLLDPAEYIQAVLPTE